MKIPAILAAVLASTVAVSAQPKRESVDKRVESIDRVNFNARKAPPPKREITRQPWDWVEIADPTPAKHGTVWIVVGTQAGSFGKLRVDAVRGKVTVQRVKVQFGDGSSKVFAVGKTIGDRRHKSTLVEFGVAKPIDRIIVTTAKNTKGEYAIFASSGGAAPAGSRTCC